MTVEILIIGKGGSRSIILIKLRYEGVMQAHCLCKVAELNTPSDGNGITGIHSAVFLMIWEIKEEKMGIKKKKTFTQIVPVAHFSHFSKNSNDCKSLPEYCNTWNWKCFTDF